MWQAPTFVEAGSIVLFVVLTLRSGITSGKGGAVLSGRAGIGTFGVVTGGGMEDVSRKLDFVIVEVEQA